MKKEMVKKPSKSKHVIYMIAVALLLVFFIAYLQQTLYPAPDYNKYCDYQTKPMYSELTTEAQCTSLGGNWSVWPEKGPDNRTGYCDLYSQCSQEYNDARIPYERNVFIINLLLGLIILISSYFLAVESLSTGFMAGGAILMIYGTIRYWGELSNVLRTFFLGVALAILVYFGYKKLKN